jgi:hypothetical protein
MPHFSGPAFWRVGVAQVRFGKYKVALPGDRRVRLGLGVALIVLGGFFGFLPVLGYWMVPLGFVVLATDIPPIRRFNRHVLIKVLSWWNKRRPREERKAARRNGSLPEKPKGESAEPLLPGQREVP